MKMSWHCLRARWDKSIGNAMSNAIDNAITNAIRSAYAMSNVMINAITFLQPSLALRALL
jgi:hypothetical protein